MSGEAAVAQRGIKWTGRTTGNNNKEDATTEVEKKTKPKDQKEEADATKKETGKKITIQKRPCAGERESDCKVTKDSKKNKREKRRKEGTGDKKKKERREEKREREEGTN